MITLKGQSIEDESFEIIDKEIGSHSYSPDEWVIVKRVIHATADFDFANQNKIVFHKEAITNGVEALKRGCNIVVDVNAVIGGLNKDNLNEFRNKTLCKISDPDVVEQAKKLGKTRAQTSMRLNAAEVNDSVVAIGNAPTALKELIQMVKENLTKPSLIIGIPVGFVCAKESKEDLEKLDIPYITNKGRKGGSSCASSIVNALFKLVKNKIAS